MARVFWVGSRGCCYLNYGSHHGFVGAVFLIKLLTQEFQVYFYKTFSGNLSLALLFMVYLKKHVQVVACLP